MMPVHEGSASRVWIWVAVVFGVLCPVFTPSRSDAQSPQSLASGRWVVGGSASKRKLRVGRHRVTFYRVEPLHGVDILLGGPMVVGLEFRSAGARRVGLKFLFDANKVARTVLDLGGHRTHRLLYFQVPTGTHRLEVSSDSPVFLRAKKLRRRSRRHDVALRFAEKARPSPSRNAVVARPAVESASKVGVLVHVRTASRKVKTQPSADQTGTRPHLTVEEQVAAKKADTGINPVTATRDESKKSMASGSSDRGRDRAVSKELDTTSRGLGVRLSLEVGAGLVKQTYLEHQGNFDVSTTVDWTVVDGIDLALDYNARFGRQQYLSRNPDPASYQPQAVNVREQFWDLGLRVGFDIVHNKWYRLLNWLGAKVSIGPQFLALANELFGSWSVGMHLGLRVEGRLSDHLHLAIWGGWLTPFAQSYSDLELAGSANHFWDYGVGLHWGFGGTGVFRTWSMGLSWRGNAIVFEHEVRRYNAALLGLATEM